MQQLVERAQRSGVGVVRVHNIRGKIAQPLPHPAQQQRVGRAPARQAQNGQTFITQQLRQLSRTRTGHQRLHVGCAGQRAGQIARRTPSAFIHNVKADFSAEPAAPNSNRPSNERPPSGLPTSRKSLEGKRRGVGEGGPFSRKVPLPQPQTHNTHITSAGGARSREALRTWLPSGPAPWDSCSEARRSHSRL